MRCSLSFFNKYDDLLADISNFLKKYDINFKLYYLKRDDMFRIMTQNKSSVKRFYDLIYKNAKYFLTRKKEKLENYVNTEILQKTTGDCNA